MGVTVAEINSEGIKAIGERTILGHCRYFDWVIRRRCESDIDSACSDQETDEYPQANLFNRSICFLV